MFCCISLVTTTSAQTAANISLAGSLVEYEGFLASGAGTFSTAIRHDAPNFALGGQGSWTIFESGNPIFQLTGAAAWLQQRNNIGFELSGTAGAFRYASEPASGHLLARGRLHYLRGRSGAWLGATTGATFNGSADSPIELALGGWTVRGQLAAIGTITRTTVGRDRYLDLALAAKWNTNALELEARAGVRPWSSTGINAGDAQTGSWIEASAILPFTERIALTLSGGSYPSDPVRRVIGANYATAGVRIAIAGSEPEPLVTLPPSVVAVLRDNTRDTSAPRIEVTPGASLRVHAAGARSIEVMADFTDWKPVAFRRVSTGVWELQTALAPGVHRLNIRVDGGEWLVPAGARTEEGDFGGTVGVVVVR